MLGEEVSTLQAEAARQMESEEAAALVLQTAEADLQEAKEARDYAAASSASRRVKEA